MPKIKMQVEHLQLYKALHRKADGTLLCRPCEDREQIYEVGKTYYCEGEIKLCKNGFHAVKNLRNIFYYYPPVWATEIAIVEADGEVEYEEAEDKICCSQITIKQILDSYDIDKILQQEKLENLQSGAVSSSKIYWKSWAVDNSTYIGGSYAISESNSIYSSHGLFKCKQIKHSEGLESCEVGADLNGCYSVDFGAYSYGIAIGIDILQSEAVHHSYAVKYSQSVNRSYGVAYSNCIYRSMYIHESEGLSNCLFCYNLKNKSFHIFNKKVKEEDYWEIYKAIKRIGQDYYPTFTKMREECVKYEGKWKVDLINSIGASSINYKTMFKNKDLINFIKSLKMYDEEIFKVITNSKKTFDIK